MTAADAFPLPLDLRMLDDVLPDGRARFRLLAPFVFRSDVFQETFTVPAGYVTDFGSIPQGLWHILQPVDPRAGKCYVIHDYLYWDEHCPRLKADDVLLEALIVREVPPLMRQAIYQGVRLFGEQARARRVGQEIQERGGQ